MMNVWRLGLLLACVGAAPWVEAATGHKASPSGTEYATVMVYFLVLLGIGYVAARRMNDLKDYFAAGKRLGYLVVAFSARATGESG